MSPNSILPVIFTIATIFRTATSGCPLSYFFDIQHCQVCSPNCICTSYNGCDACLQGYTMFRGICIQCPQSSGIYGTCSNCCSKTSGTILSCTNCVSVPNYYSFLKSGRCIMSQGCLQIDKNGYCLVCTDGYYSSNNLCLSCDQSCSSCADLTNCFSCASGYYWEVVSYGLCSPCPAGCATCANHAICHSCLNKYYFYKNQCIKCPSNCETCLDGSTCISCTFGILISNLCILCNQTTYGGSIGCLECQNNRNFVKCTKCDSPYFLDGNNGVCRPCATYISGAKQCVNSKIPTQCINDYDPVLTNRYYLVGIICMKNIKSCKQMGDIYGNCSTCYPNYILNNGICVECPFSGCSPANATVENNTCICTNCIEGYYLSGVMCLPCTTLYCSICPNNVCSACLQNFYYSGGSCLNASIQNCLQSQSATTCLICVMGYYLGSDLLCHSCQANCLNCTSRFNCLQCNSSTFLTNGYCITYPSNCVQAVLLGSSPSCTLCQAGYYLSSGICLPCNIELGTLSKCNGLCPKNEYIKNIMVQVIQYQHLFRVCIFFLIFVLSWSI